MITRGSTCFFLTLWLANASLCACQSKPKRVAHTTTPSAVSAASAATAERQNSSVIGPVYSQTHSQADPRALKFCSLIHDLTETRRAACCQTPPAATLAESCSHSLSQALADGAVRLDEQALAICQQQLESAVTGCGWVGPLPAALPAGCLAVLHGTLANAGSCRSSLECETGLFCRGAGPTQRGQCAAPARAGAMCNLSADVLGAYTKLEAQLQTAHPECEGFCQRHLCTAHRSAGSACAIDLECGPGQRCVNQTCSALLALQVGDSCSGAGCPSGSRCQKGHCVALQLDGAACDSDFDCRGGCNRPHAGQRGSCGMRCDLR